MFGASESQMVIEWLFGYGASKLVDAGLNKALAKTIDSKLRKTAEDWAAKLPSNLSLAKTEALFPGALVDEELETRPELKKLRRNIETNQIPDTDLWYGAFIEQWRHVRKLGDGIQDFFLADEEQVSNELKKLAKAMVSVCEQHPDFFRVEVLKLLKKNEAEVSDIKAAIGAVFSGVDAIIDPIIEGEIEAMETFRLAPDFQAREKARFLSHRLLKGDFQSGSALLRARALGWCIRVLSIPETRQEAEKLLDECKALPACAELNVARALMSAEYGAPEIPIALRTLGTNLSYSAAVICVLNTQGLDEAIDWLDALNLQFHDLDASAQASILIKYIHKNRWSEAAELADKSPREVCELNPVLADIEGIVFVAMACHEEDRHVLPFGVPFESASFRLSDDSAALHFRERAIECFEFARQAYFSAELSESATDADLWCLWLRLKSPKTRDHAKTELNQRVRDREKVLLYANLGLRFGADITKEDIRKAIQRDRVLNGHLTSSAASALLATILHNPNVNEVANELAANRLELDKALHSDSLILLEVEVLCRAGRVTDAKDRISSLEAINPDTEEKLNQIIAEATADDPALAVLHRYQESESIHDLAALVGALEEKGDPVQLATYALKLFEATGSYVDATVYLSALDQAGQHAEVDKFLYEHTEAVENSRQFAERFAQTLYFDADFFRLFDLLDRLRTVEDNSHLRELYVAGCLETGQWDKFGSFAQLALEEWESRTAAELIQAAQLVLYSAPELARQLTFAAVNKTPQDPYTLSAAYFIATSAGWELDEAVSEWLQSAAELSGEKGPIQTADLQELVDAQPEWRARELKIWTGYQKGEYPVPIVAQAINRSPLSLILSTAAANRAMPDIRRRSGVPSYHGKHQAQIDSSIQSILVDSTALMALSDLEMLEFLPTRFETVAVPHGTLSLLYRSLQKLFFHQPSRIRLAQAILDCIARGELHQIYEAPKSDPYFIEEVGVRTAALISEAQRLRENANNNIWLVHPGKVTKATSLGRELADLKECTALIINCTPIVMFLRSAGALTKKEYERIKAYLRLRGEEWSDDVAPIESGAVLLLDSLALNYLVELKLVGPLVAENVRLFALALEIEEASDLVGYDKRAAEVATRVEAIRSFVKAGVDTGKVVITARRSSQDIEPELSPLINAIRATDGYNGFLCDDRAVNAKDFVGEGAERIPVLTSLRLIDALHEEGMLSADQWFDFRHRLRASAYLFVPVTTKDLTYALKDAQCEEGMVRETAELKAIREYISYICMSDWLQPGTEFSWFSELFASVHKAIREQWRNGCDYDQAAAISTWLLELFDVRDSLRFRSCSADELADKRALQLWVYSGPSPDWNGPTQTAFLKWFDEIVAAPAKYSEPDVYRKLLGRIKEFYWEVAGRGAER